MCYYEISRAKWQKSVRACTVMLLNLKPISYEKGRFLMYQALLILQYIGIIAIFFEILYVVRQRSSRLQTLLLLVMFFTLINIVGYTLEMAADTKELAMQTLKVTYIGKPFILFSLYLFVMEYCGSSVSKTLRNVFFLICLTITSLVFTNEHHMLFYSSVGFTQDGLFPHVILGHGILYNIYTIFLCYYFIGMIIVCIKKYKKTESAIIRKQLLLLLTLIIFSIVCLAAYLAGLTNGYDATAIAYLVAVFFFERLMRRYGLFDTLTLAKDEAIDHMKNGLIVTDLYGNKVYSNAEADKVLQCVRELGHKNKPLEYLKELATQSKPLFISQKLAPDLEEISGNENYVYDLSLRDIQHDKMNYGQMLIITENTGHYYYTERLQNEVAKKTKEVILMQREIVGSFAAIIEARDGITGLHIKNTGNLVRVLVNIMAEDDRYNSIITTDYAQMVADAAHLHDIGKVAIPDSILQKKGKLTDEEFAVMKTHPQEGAKILDNTIKGFESDAYYQIAHDMVLYHHERYDGNGYPTGIGGTDIPLAARIMAVADVYEALRSKRHYKDGFPKEKSMVIIRENIGTQFDPDIAAIFLDHIDEMEAVLDTGDA